MLQRARLVAASETSSGPEHCIDVVDMAQTTIFAQGLRFRTALLDTACSRCVSASLVALSDSILSPIDHYMHRCLT